MRSSHLRSNGCRAAGVEIPGRMSHTGGMSLYDEQFYEAIRETSLRSAGVIVPMVRDLVGPVRSVVDFGCGTGAWLSVFRQYGADRVLGLDGDHVDTDRLEIPTDAFRPTALDQPISLGETFDLAITLEVVEHLPKRRARGVVNELIAAAPVVLFSAATPGQGGDGHQNEQWQHIWAQAFEERGYVTIDVLRPRLWADDRVSWWYAQNLLMFASPDACAARPALAEAARRTDKSMISVVHPRCLSARLSFFRNAVRDLMRERDEALAGQQGLADRKARDD